MSAPEKQAEASPLGGPVAKPKPTKPKSNIYTMMLMLSFFALCTACAVLYFELSAYGDYPWWEVPADVRSATSP